MIGDHFWPGAVAALSEPDIDDSAGWLDDLESRSIVVRRPTSAIRGEPEYRFRHDLIAEVAYARVAKRKPQTSETAAVMRCIDDLSHVVSARWRTRNLDFSNRAQHRPRSSPPVQVQEAPRCWTT